MSQTSAWSLTLTIIAFWLPASFSYDWFGYFAFSKDRMFLAVQLSLFCAHNYILDTAAWLRELARACREAVQSVTQGNRNLHDLLFDQAIIIVVVVVVAAVILIFTTTITAAAAAAATTSTTTTTTIACLLFFFFFFFGGGEVFGLCVCACVCV